MMVYIWTTLASFGGLRHALKLFPSETLKISKLRGLKVVTKANGCFSVLCSFGQVSFSMMVQ